MVLVFGPNGSADAFGTWLIVMFLGAAVCAGGGLLAYRGRWRRWYRPVETPVRYAPLAAIPFGIGCLIEFGATLFPLGNAAQQVVVVAPSPTCAVSSRATCSQDCRTFTSCL